MALPYFEKNSRNHLELGDEDEWEEEGDEEVGRPVDPDHQGGGRGARALHTEC